MNDRHSRQSFLGVNLPNVLATARIGVVGTGGGGSHVVQQLAHIGFRNVTVFEPDVVEHSNLNRLVGATLADATSRTPKVDVSRRMVEGLVEDPALVTVAKRWQDEPRALHACDIAVGCVDNFGERAQLEAECRRYLIPLIDIGLDVATIDDEPPIVGGQVIVSMPGGPCMRCIGFLTDEVLAREGARYGDAGPRPQVVWANGVLASTAVGIVVDLLVDWTRRRPTVLYLEYRGNEGIVREHSRAVLQRFGPCSHFPLDSVGPQRFRPL